MTRSAPVFRVRTEFDDFLFAPIDEDGDGHGMLSVLSALTRLDVDPWQEAAELARLPGDKATQRLALLIKELPDRPSARRDLGAIAARLAALLPRRETASIPARAASLGLGAAATKSPIGIRVIFFVILAIVLGALWIATNR